MQQQYTTPAPGGSNESAAAAAAPLDLNSLRRLLAHYEDALGALVTEVQEHDHAHRQLLTVGAILSEAADLIEEAREALGGAPW